MWGYSIHLWELVFRWATISALVFGGFGITAAFVSAWIGYELTDVVQKDADKRILEASTKGDEARAEAEKAKSEIASAQLEIASAKERAASLEKEAAQARAEQERLKQIVSWRVLSKEAGEKLVSLLAKNKALITLAYVGADPEVLGLAIQFSKIFEAAHWQVLSSAMTFSSQLVFEIRLPGPENETVQLLRSAFNQAGISFVTEDVPQPDMSFARSAPEKPAATVFIGSKRPPF